MKRILSGLLLVLLSLPAWAGGPGAVRKQIESSMLLTGTIVVEPDGRVGEYAIDHADKVRQGVLDFVGGNVGRWQFEPALVEGKPVRARNRMSIRLVANKQENGNYSVRIGSAHFDPMQAEEGSRPVSENMEPPPYPVAVARAGISGTVYLVAKVNRQGRVEDVVAEQVNLRVVTSDNQMEKIRKLLAAPALQAARGWTFTPPSKGAAVGKPFWSLRIPVDLLLAPASRPDERYGQWETYVPGPRQSVPWRNWEDLPDFSPDSMVAGGVNPVGPGDGLRLLTPLGES